MREGARPARFELGLLADRSIDKPITLGDLLELTEHGSAWPGVQLGDATLFFESEGTDWMPLHWVLGDLASLGRQFAAAAERLRAGDIAIVRSAVDDRVVVAYFLFEANATEVAVSLFFSPPHLRYVYPIAPARGEELYDYVREHRHELLAREPDDDNQRDIRGATMPRDQMIEAIEREADRARRVVALLGTDEPSNSR